MNKIMHTYSNSFFKICAYSSTAYNNLNTSLPCYNDKRVDIVSITPVGTNNDGYPLFCYELLYKE
jgi:hypothetical protein